MPRIRNEDKDRLLKCHHDGNDFIELAIALGVNVKSARSIIRRSQINQNPLRHGGHKPKIITEEISGVLLNFVELEPTATLAQMVTYLQHVVGIVVSKTCISDFLDGRLLTYKRVRDVVADRNSVRVKEERFQYATWYLEVAQFNNVIFLYRCI